MGFPGDGFKDKDTKRDEVRDQTEDGDDTEINSEDAGSGHGSVKKRKTSGVVPQETQDKWCGSSLSVTFPMLGSM